MLAEVGFATLIMALAAALYAIVASVYGELRHQEGYVLSGRNAALLVTALLTIATGALWLALVQQEYQIKYVWSVSSPAMPDFYRVTALWGSQSGSLLFWSFLMGVFSAGAIVLNWRSHRRLMPYAIAVMMAVIVFFLGIKIFIENPFERWWIMPDLPRDSQVISASIMPAGALTPDALLLAQSAQGLNPLLRHFGMAIHPPMLYLGFVGFLIPFAFAVAALASGDLSTNWIKASRRWALIAWLFLSLGLILGGRWAYDVLGWGGYWGWDPVENAAFLPWLIGTALLHSIMIQEKRGMLKVWNMFLMVGTFSAIIFGTFATRSGLVESVHSFARSGVGFPMFFFWFLMTLISVALILWRRSRGELRDEHAFTSIFSRESLFVLNNFIFVALALVIFWGSFGAPIVSELFLNTDITLGKDYFMQVTPPLFLALYILMGIAPLSAWSATSLVRLGRSLLVPLLLTLASVGLFAVGGMSTPVALVGYGVVLLAGWIAVYETLRGIIARQKSHPETVLHSLAQLYRRNPRRYGGYMIHLGVTIIGIGIIGSTLFQVETQRTLAVGESLALNGYELHFDQFDGQAISEDGRIMDIATMSLWRDGQKLATLRPRRDFFPQTEGMNSMTIAGAHSTLENDFYVLLVGWEALNASSATFKVYINPLVNLIWWGSFILILGTLLAGWPRDILPERVRQSRPVTLPRGTKGALS
ncbi:MAG: cytochrome c biogenesis protein CcsA [Anaerolineae bacterium]|jgi:cytochrome c-type biogenesis protein CcmF|nr:cytochrome c biogenesis protein CcsA [Anaerolineae bacterium]